MEQVSETGLYGLSALNSSTYWLPPPALAESEEGWEKAVPAFLRSSH